MTEIGRIVSTESRREMSLTETGLFYLSELFDSSAFVSSGRNIPKRPWRREITWRTTEKRAWSCSRNSLIAETTKQSQGGRPAKRGQAEDRQTDTIKRQLACSRNRVPIHHSSISLEYQRRPEECSPRRINLRAASDELINAGYKYERQSALW